MTTPEAEGTYQGLPEVTEEIRQFIVGPFLNELFELREKSLDAALGKIDEEMEGLGKGNPSLYQLVRGTVEGLYEIFSNELPSERARADLRVFGFFNQILLLRALDMAWRKEQPS